SPLAAIPSGRQQSAASRKSPSSDVPEPLKKPDTIEATSFGPTTCGKIGCSGYFVSKRGSSIMLKTCERDGAPRASSVRLYSNPLIESTAWSRKIRWKALAVDEAWV